MNKRKLELESILSLHIRNQTCLAKDLVTILEQCERDIINVVFEKVHGERLYLDHVIEHLTQLSVEKGIHDSETIIKMLESLSSFKRYIKDIKKGCKGERFAKKALERMTIPYSLIENIELNYNDEFSEDDLIVISKNGLFIIEVKYSDSNMIITKDGFLMHSYDSYNSYDSKNVLEQVSKERYIVRSLLAKKLNLPDMETLSKKIHSVILFANKDRKLFDHSNSGCVCYCHNIAKYISEFETDYKLTNEEIEQFQNVLEECRDTKMYEIDFDLDELRNSLVDGIVLIESIDKNEEEINVIPNYNDSISKKGVWEFDLKSASLGTLFGLLLSGIGYGTYHYLAKQN